MKTIFHRCYLTIAEAMFANCKMCWETQVIILLYIVSRVGLKWLLFSYATYKFITVFTYQGLGNPCMSNRMWEPCMSKTIGKAWSDGPGIEPEPWNINDGKLDTHCYFSVSFFILFLYKVIILTACICVLKNINRKDTSMHCTHESASSIR